MYMIPYPRQTFKLCDIDRVSRCILGTTVKLICLLVVDLDTIGL